MSVLIWIASNAHDRNEVCARTFAKRVVHIGSTSSTPAALMRVKSLSDFVLGLAVFQHRSCSQQRSELTVIPMSSSARIREAYEVASSD